MYTCQTLGGPKAELTERHLGNAVEPCLYVIDMLERQEVHYLLDTQFLIAREQVGFRSLVWHH